MKLKSIFCCSSRFGESNLWPERIRNPVENVFVPVIPRDDLHHIRPHLLPVGIGFV